MATRVRGTEGRAQGIADGVAKRKPAKRKAARRARPSTKPMARRAGEAVGGGVAKVTKVIALGAGLAKLGATKSVRRVGAAAVGIGASASAFAKGFWGAL